MNIFPSKLNSSVFTHVHCFYYFLLCLFTLENGLVHSDYLLNHLQNDDFLSNHSSFIVTFGTNIIMNQKSMLIS